MTTTLFSLPPEVRCSIYAYVFADSHSVFDFNTDTLTQATSSGRKRSFTVSSRGELGFLLASKQCHLDAIESYHEARTVCIRNLSKEGLDDFAHLDQVCSKAKTVELDSLYLNDMSLFPSLPRLQRLVLNGVRMWGGNMIVQRGQTANEAFDDTTVLGHLFKNVRYSSLMIEERISRLFPTAHIVVNFRVGHQVLDKNMLRGIQDWDWSCSYDVKTEKLEKKLAHKLVLW